MTDHELFMWGKNHHFPQLVLRANPREIIRAGAVSWWLFTLLASDEMLSRAEMRAKQWNEYERMVQGA